MQNEEKNTKPSRSAHKRRSLALQNIGARLTRLDPEALRKLNLPPKLYEAVCRYDGTRGHEARRRQMQVYRPPLCALLTSRRCIACQGMYRP